MDDIDSREIKEELLVKWGKNQEKAVSWRDNAGAKNCLEQRETYLKGSNVQPIDTTESSRKEIHPLLDHLEDTGDLYQRK